MSGKTLQKYYLNSSLTAKPSFPAAYVVNMPLTLLWHFKTLAISLVTQSRADFALLSKTFSPLIYVIPP